MGLVPYQAHRPRTRAHSGLAQLCLGRDQASSGGAFTGTVDEFQLSSKTLTPDAVRGLTWFAGGTNSVLIPRGVLYDSLLFKQMTSTDSSDIVNGPLANAVVQSNANNASAHLNSAVIQMTITKNVTLEEAYRFLGLLWTNKTGKVTAFAFPATGEFYTLGFAWEVTKLVGNTSVANGGTYTT